MTEKTKSIKLLSCPYCAGEAEMIDGGPAWYKGARFYVNCRVCGARSSSTVHETAEAAALEWNARAGQAPDAASSLDARTNRLLGAYREDMEDTLGKLAEIVGAKKHDADALIEKVRSLHAAADSALNVLIGNCVSGGGCDDGALIAQAKSELREALKRF